MHPQVRTHKSETIRRPEGVAARLVDLVGGGSRVLLVGDECAELAGGLRGRGCRVVAVAPDAEAAARASAACDRAVVADPARPDLARTLDEDGFDVAAVVGVLEHAEDPVALLGELRRRLRPEGYLVASAPNASHAATRASLLGGRLSRGDERPPLRLFTLEGLQSLFQEAGFAIGHVDRQEWPLGDEPTAGGADHLSAELLEALARAPEARTYRFLAVAYPSVHALGALAHRLRQRDARDEALRAEVADLRRAVAEQARRLGGLEAKLESLARGEARLREVVGDDGGPGRGHDAGLQSVYESLRSGAGREAAGTAVARAAGRLRNGRMPAEYPRMIERIREAVRTALPPDARVIVVSRGDEELIRLGTCRGWHFPQIGGVYAGHHPADSRAAIEHLEELRGRGGEFLLFPQTAFWWLDHYADFKRHLDERYEPVVQREDACVIYRLKSRQSA